MMLNSNDCNLHNPLKYMMRLGLMILTLISSASAEEEKFTREFSYPPHLVQVLKSKYEGKTLKELLSNAGANLNDDDVVVGPNGAGVVVRSTANNLETIEEIIKSCDPLLSAFYDHEETKKTILKNTWDFTNLGIGILQFRSDKTAVVEEEPHGTKYKWVLTKQNVIEFRTATGKMLFTATISQDTMEIRDFHSKPSLTITVLPTDRKTKKEPPVTDDPFRI